MSTRNRRPAKAPALDPTERITAALVAARRLARLVKSGDEDLLARATLLQGVLSGDVVAASIHTRQRMQREILRLKTRLAHAHLKTESVKQRLLEIEADRFEHADLPGTTLTRIYEIYGLKPPRETRALPAATVTVEAQPSQKSLSAQVEPADTSLNP
jgi:hypothetical protein